MVLTYVIFAVVGVLLFWRLQARTAVLLCVIGGWAFLPVGVYPPDWPGQEGTEFPYWIIGLGLPSDMLLTKAWVCPVVALVGVMVWDFERARRFRWSWVDLLPGVWCLSPLGAALAGRPSDPAAWVSVLYLTGSWGISWWLGRAYFSDIEGRRVLVWGLVIGGLVYVPICALEGVLKPSVYRWVYGWQPYDREGIVRYIGYRPLGFLEHGNQLGMWLAGSALLAGWMAIRRQGGRAMRFAGIALPVACVAAQSVGAVILLLVGLGTLVAGRWVSIRWLLIGAVGVGVLAFGVYASGVVPFRKIAETTPFGQQALEMLRSTGRGSLGYRIAQDEKHLQAAYQTGLLGSGRWDWWRGKTSRPWGHWLLVVGQFGAIGFAAYVGVMGWPVGRTFWFLPRSGGGPPDADVLAGLAMLLAISLVDVFLNSFILLPTLLIAGGLATCPIGTLPNASGGGVRLPPRQSEVRLPPGLRRRQVP